MTVRANAAGAEAPVQGHRRFPLSVDAIGVPLLTGALGLAAVVVTLVLAGDGLGPDAWGTLPITLGWPVIAVLYLLAEVLVVHLEVGRETHSFSLTEIPLVMGLFLGTPGDLVLGHVLGAGLALAIHRHQSPRKLAFNVASFAFSTSLAAVAFGLLVDPADPLGPRGWLAAGVAAMTADLVSAMNVQAVIAVSTGERFRLAAPSLSGIRYCLVNACLGLVATTLLVLRPEMAWLAVVLTLALFGAYRVSVRERRERHRLAGLQEATAAVQGELAGDVEGRLLGRARDMTGARRAGLVLAASGGRSARWTMLDRDGRLLTGEMPISDEAGPHASDVDAAQVPDPLLRTWREVCATGVPIGRNPARATPHSPDESAGLMAAPIRHGDSVTGMLVVLDREGNVGGWPAGELPLLETLANHAGVTLRNRELLDGLAARASENEWLARHDAHTGLPDRAWFVQLATAAMSRAPGAASLRASHAASAILALVPDGFGEVRETLGHAHADDLLRQLATRLAAVAGTAPLGRLDGDSFAMLVVAPVDPVAMAESLRAQLVRPFAIDGLQLALEATVGVATDDGPLPDASMLLRQAERAVVQARASGVAFASYRPERDAHSPERLALMGELRHALEAQELGVHFQAKVRPTDGELLGAEALVRWFHATRGPIPPDTFIPLAERTSLLRPLTLQVLERAVAGCVAWRSAGRTLGVAVNLSPRNLLDTRLVGDVAAVLTRAGLAPGGLTLEVTEGAVMADPARSLAVLGELRSLGVRLAIDDYGAGHASLAWLRELPVHELKVDRSFVRGLEHEPASQAIVRSTIDLAHDLGLAVVAEGVEDAWSMTWLAAHGCDAVQGYHVARPERAEAFAARLMESSRLTG